MTVVSIRRLQEALEAGAGEAIPAPLRGFYRSLVTLQARLEEETPEPAQPDPERLKEGLTLLRWEDLPLDWGVLPQSFREAVAVFRRYPELFGEIPEELEEQAHLIFTPELVRAWFTGVPFSQTAPASEALLSDIVHAVLQPVLLRYSRAWLGKVDQERWRRGYCPVCGGNPDLSYLERENGSRRLVCSRCDSEWLFQRLECPYCRNTDQNTLAYFTDERSLYRLYVCDKCRHYLKTIDLRQREGEVILPLERLATLGLDQQAREQGYQPGGALLPK